MKTKLFSFCLYAGLVLLLAARPNAHAAMLVYSDKTAFLSYTGATLASGALPSGGPYTTLTLGTVTYQSATGLAFSLGDYSTRLAGNELSIDGTESINLLAAAPVYSMGFDFVEPEFDQNVNAPFIDSTFTVTLVNGATPLGSFTFNAPNDTAAFVGVLSDAPFTGLQIRETVGGSENEFFGQAYTGAAARAVPEPSTLAVLLLGGAGVWLARRCVAANVSALPAGSLRRFCFLAAIAFAVASGAGSARAATLYQWTAASGLFPNQVATSTGYMPVTLTDSANPENPVFTGGMLQLSTDQYVENMFYTVPLAAAGNGASLGSLPISIELTAKVISSASSDNRRAGLVLALTAGNDTGNAVQISGGEMFISSATFTRGAAAAVNTTDAFHTYRIDYSGYTAGSTFSVYYDNALKLSGALYSSSQDNGTPDIGVYFGEGSSLALGTVQLQSMRIYNVPEPSAWTVVVALATVGGFLLRRGRARS